MRRVKKPQLRFFFTRLGAGRIMSASFPKEAEATAPSPRVSKPERLPRTMAKKSLAGLDASANLETRSRAARSAEGR
jgi:hypothetical protein